MQFCDYCGLKSTTERLNHH